VLKTLTRDPYYKAAFEKWPDMGLMVTAGFIDIQELENEPFVRDEDVAWPSFPFGKLRRALTQSTGDRPLLFLLSTGSFSPFHRGHVEMMERARTAYQAAGYDVVGGALSPSHDAYVSLKQNGRAALDIGVRLEIMYRTLEDHSWLVAEPWEATGTPYALGFTDVIARTESVLKKYFPHTPMEVAYVFGADNETFMHSFVGKGMAACVARGPSSTFTLQAEDWIDPDRMMFVDEATQDVSSTFIRKRRGMPSQSNCGRIDKEVREGCVYKGRYGVRDDWPLIARKWGVDKMSLSPTHDIISILQKNIPSKDIAWDVIDVAHQESWAMAHYQKTDFPLVSLDAFIAPQPYMLSASRCFSLGEGQYKALRMVARPESDIDIDTQIASLPLGPLGVLDDDTVSGQTLRFLDAALYPSRSVCMSVFLSEAMEKKDPLFDVVDVRDFIFGSPFGGLVVEGKNGEPVRVPYMAPFVNLVSRSSVPAANSFQMSVDLWKFNAAFLLTLHTFGARLEETTGIERIFDLCGETFDREFPYLCMSNLCAKMAAYLEKGAL
jgi:nicotinic acid mononucleotide adenylyltransferase